MKKLKLLFIVITAISMVSCISGKVVSQKGTKIEKLIIEEIEKLDFTVGMGKKQILEFVYKIENVEFDKNNDRIIVLGNFRLDTKNFNSINLEYDSKEDSYIGKITYEYPSGGAVWQIKLNKKDL